LLKWNNLLRIKLLYKFGFPLILSGFILFIGCSSSKSTESEEKSESTEVSTEEEATGALIINTAKEEQLNEMYSKTKDSTYLYWLNNKLILLKNQTKCNIFALNTLFKAGFKTPNVNALTRDLADTSKFTDELPIIGTSDPELAKKGDLIVWNGHVIIFDQLTKIKNDYYAFAWWAGTSQADNGDNVINNVIYGKYKLSGHYIIRRPIKKS
jgi:hypothetical protein